LVLSAAIFDLKQAYNLSLILAQNCFVTQSGAGKEQL